MCHKRNQKRNEKRIEKRNQEEEHDEEIRIRLSDKRFVSCCIIEDSSLTFYGLFSYCLQMDGTWRIEK